MLAVTYVGGEMAQSTLGLPSAATGVFQAMLLFFLLATDILDHATGCAVRRPRREAA